jgi:two-component system, chemotaxis family, protein-glutamate methylesterase/glutaminase
LPSRDIVVIGASADGVQTLQDLVRPLPANLTAALFVVLHTGPGGEHPPGEAAVPAGEGGEA